MLTRIDAAIRCLLLALLASAAAGLLGLLAITQTTAMWKATYAHALIPIVLAWVVQPRLLIYGIVMLAPLLLINQRTHPGFAALDSLLLLLLAGATSRAAWQAGRAAMGVRNPDTEESRLRVRLPDTALPPLVELSLLLLVLATLASAVAVAPAFLEVFEAWPRLEGASTPGLFMATALYAWEPPAQAWRQPLHLLMAIGLLIYARHHGDVPMVRRIVQLGLALACILAVLGLGEYFGLIALAPLRPNFEMPNHVLGTRRLLSLAQHSGWLAQFFAFTVWGVLVWWASGRRGWRLLSVGTAALLALASVLMLQRGWWLILAGMIATISLLYMGRRGVRPVLRQLRPHAWIIAACLIAALGLIAIADVVADHAISRRVASLLLYRDRINYVHSTAHLATVAPWGIGLGMHQPVYASMFLPPLPTYQADHADAHNLWLMMQAERGPLAVLAITLLPLAVLARVWQRRLTLDPERRNLVICLALGLIAIFLYGIFQGIFYLWIIEILTFLWMGLLLALVEPSPAQAGHAPNHPPAQHPLRRHALMALALVAAGAMAVATAQGQVRFHRTIMPALVPFGPDQMSQWTSSRWLTALPLSVRSLELRLTNLPNDQKKVAMVRIENGPSQMVVAEPGHSQLVRFVFEPTPCYFPKRFRWLEVEVWPVTPERRLNPGGGHRMLGLYLTDIQMDFP